MLAALADWLSVTGMTTWAGGGVYPVANIVHILGIILLVGGIGIVDLRLMGLFPALPASPLIRAMMPFAVAGFILMLLSGSILFAADASAVAASPVFGWKLAFIAAAVANAAAFRWLIRTGAGKAIAAGISLGLWLTVVILGRLIAYS